MWVVPFRKSGVPPLQRGLRIQRWRRNQRVRWVLIILLIALWLGASMARL